MFYLFNRYHSRKYFFIVLPEAFLIFSVVLLSTAVRLKFRTLQVEMYDPSFIKTGVLTLVYLVSFYYFDLYTPDMYRPGRLMLMKLAKAMLAALIVLFTVFFLFPSLKAGRGVLLVNTFVLPVFFLGWRMVFSKWLSVELPSKNVLIIGSGELAKKIGIEIYRQAVHGLKLVGFVDNDPGRFGQPMVNPGVIGGYGDIGTIVAKAKIDRIIVALPDRREKLPMSALLECKMRGVAVEEGETFNEKMTGKIPLDHLKPSWMVFSDGFKSLRSRKVLKRIFDVFLSVAGFIIISPVLLFTAALIKLESSGPVIFKQTRVGEHGKEFEIYKFRSMRLDAEEKTGPVWAGAQDDRVTRVGRIIRKLRIDELPQMINVIKGDMSFVGPRPERPYFVNKLKASIPYYEIRNVAKPGITGWAQIMYPYGATVEDALEKLQYDIYYIKNMSPLLDLLVIFWTIKVVLSRRGAR